MRMRVTGMVGSYKLRYKFLGNYQFVSLHTDTEHEQVDGDHNQNMMKNLFDSVLSCYSEPSDCHDSYYGFDYDLSVFKQSWPSLARWTH